MINLSQPTKIALTQPNLTSAIQELSTNLQAIAPTEPKLAETTQLINYALIATAVVGIFVYHYLKENEKAQ